MRSDPLCPPGAITAAGPAACAAWQEFAAGRGLRPSTVQHYRSMAKRFLRWLEGQGIALTEVTAAIVERFLDAHDVALASKSMYRTALRRLYDSLAAQGVVSANLAECRSPAASVPALDGASDATPPQHLPGTLEALKAFVHDLDNISEDSDNFRPGLVAMYPIIVGGMDASEIAAFTGIPLPEVELYVGRLRENRIWDSDGKIVVDFDDPGSPEAIVNLVLIVGCAAGIFRRFPAGEDGDQPTKALVPAPSAGADQP